MCTDKKHRRKWLSVLLTFFPILYAIENKIRYVTADTVNDQSGTLLVHKFHLQKIKNTWLTIFFTMPISI